MRIIFIFTMFFIYSTAFAETFCFFDYRFIDPKEFDSAKAAMPKSVKLKGKAAEKALKNVAAFDKDGRVISIYDNVFDDVEMLLYWYDPAHGIAFLGSEFGDNLFDTKKKVWLEYNPDCTKTSPNGQKRIACTVEQEGLVYYYYQELENGQYVSKKHLLGDNLCIADYYWVDNDSIKCMKQVNVEGDDIFLPALVKIISIETIDVKATPLEESEYDKSKAMQYRALEADAKELKDLVSYEGKFVKSLKTRSGKELTIIPGELVFSAYYPELDIIRLEFYNNMYLYYTYNLTTGETYDTIGNPETWAISPDGKHRINYIEDLYWLEEKREDGNYHKLARLRIKGLMKDYYWQDNKTLYFTHVISDKSGKWTSALMSAELLP